MLSSQYYWYLCGVTDEAGPPSVIRIDDSRFVVGRRPGVSLRLDSRFISGQHAELTVRGERLYVADLGSRNGVFINGERVRKGELGLGDLLTLGDLHFRVRRQHPEDGLDEDDSLADLHVEWLGGQLDRLLEEESAFPLLRPVYGILEDAIVGYNVTTCSNTTGLESESKMVQAAVQLGRESDVNRAMLTCSGSAAQRVEEGRWLCLQAPPAVNSELELLPALQSLRANSPEAEIIVTFSDLPGRSLRSLKNLAAALDDLSMSLGMTEFLVDQQRFIQTANLTLKYVRLADSLASALFRDSEAYHTRARSLANALHDRRIRLAVGKVATREQLEVCRELGFDFADGTFLEEAQRSSQPLPETGILTSSQVAAMFSDAGQQIEAAVPNV